VCYDGLFKDWIVEVHVKPYIVVSGTRGEPIVFGNEIVEFGG
jgi:hypothetical protein